MTLLEVNMNFHRTLSCCECCSLKCPAVSAPRLSAQIGHTWKKKKKKKPLNHQRGKCRFVTSREATQSPDWEMHNGLFLQHSSCQSSAPPAGGDRGRGPPPQCSRRGMGSTPTTHPLLQICLFCYTVVKDMESVPLRRGKISEFTAAFCFWILSELSGHF